MLGNKPNEVPGRSDESPGSAAARCRPAAIAAAIRRRSFTPAVAWVFAAALVATAPVATVAETQPQPPARSSGIAYSLEITGEMEPSLRELIEQSAGLITQADRPPATTAALRRRITDDVDTIQRILRSEGFFAGEVSWRVDETRSPLPVELQIETGPIFLLADWEVTYSDEPPDPGATPDLEEVGLELGMRGRAETLVAAERRLLRRLAERGRPYATLATRRYLADHDQAVLRAELEVDPGPEVTFGALSIEGLSDVDEEYLRRTLAWPAGETYDEREVERVRNRLVRMNLFESVLVERAAQPDADNNVGVTARLIEQPHRSIGIGLNYATDDVGLSAEAFWEHRNLFGEGEELALSAEGSLLRQGFEGRFRKPHFRRLDQALVASTEIVREDSDAFEELTLSAFAGLERRLDDRWTVQAGPRLMLTEVKEDGERSRFALVGARGTVTYDSRDQLLNPTLGLRASYTLTPLASVAGERTQFVINEATAATYLSMTGDDRIVLAGRGRIGAMAGASRGDVPANLRFYAGGGGSVRGFGYRSIGPLDSDDEPIGGLSVIELSVEARFRVSETIGLVPFIDAGQVYTNPWPNLSDPWRFAAGLGLRYFTAFGPLRLDVAVPINRRQGVDDRFQVYISIGQAF